MVGLIVEIINKIWKLTINFKITSFNITKIMQFIIKLCIA